MMKNCTRCNAEFDRSHTMCLDCFRAYQRERRDPAFKRRYANHRTAIGTPPKPPPGFHLSDLTTGKPLG